MTMHSSKGLEFRVVFILDANEGITPHHRAQLEADLEEERRMFYVAITRARIGCTFITRGNATTRSRRFPVL